MSPAVPLRSGWRRIANAAARLHDSALPVVRRGRALEILRRSGLFDPEFYAVAGGVGPFATLESALRHYLSTGAARGLAPHPAFDPTAYRAAAEARGERVGNPLLHYLLVGSRRGIAPSRTF